MVIMSMKLTVCYGCIFYWRNVKVKDIILHNMITCAIYYYCIRLQEMEIPILKFKFDCPIMLSGYTLWYIFHSFRQL